MLGFMLSRFGASKDTVLAAMVVVGRRTAKKQPKVLWSASNRYAENLEPPYISQALGFAVP